MQCFSVPALAWLKGCGSRSLVIRLDSGGELYHFDLPSTTLLSAKIVAHLVEVAGVQRLAASWSAKTNSV